MNISNLANYLFSQSKFKVEKNKESEASDNKLD